MMVIKKRLSRPGMAAMVIAVALFSLSACTAANYGKLKSNSDMTQAFETYQALPDHRYYYRGTASRPTVIAGISESYHLSSKLWVEIDPASGEFRQIIDRISLQGSGGTTRPWAFDILDNTGKVVGVWYSAARAAVVEIDEKGRIKNLSPIGIVTRGDQPN